MANIWGTLVIYVASYLYQYNEQAKLSTVAMAFPLQSLAWAVGMGITYSVTGAAIYHRFGGRVSIALGLIPVIIGTLVASFLTDMYWFLAVYLGLTGYGASNIIINSIWVGWGVLANKRGLAAGVSMLGFGLGASAIGLGFSLAMNPHNESPTLAVTDGNQHEHLFTASVAHRLPWTMRGAAIVYTVVGAISLLLLEEHSVSDQRSSLIQSVASWKKAAGVNCPNVGVAARTSAFWNLIAYSFSTNAFEMFMLVEYKNYALTASHNDQLISAIGSIGLLCNTTCRFLVSTLMDYISFKKLSMVVMLMQVTLSLTIHLVVDMPMVYAVWVCVTFMCFAATFAPIAIICGQIFGPVYCPPSTGSKVFPIVTQGAVAAIVFIVPLISFVVRVKTTQPYGFTPAFYILAVIAGSACVLLLQLRTKYEWGQGSEVFISNTDKPA